MIEPDGGNAGQQSWSRWERGVLGAGPPPEHDDEPEAEPAAADERTLEEQAAEVRRSLAQLKQWSEEVRERVRYQ